MLSLNDNKLRQTSWSSREDQLGKKLPAAIAAFLYLRPTVFLDPAGRERKEEEESILPR